MKLFLEQEKTPVFHFYYESVPRMSGLMPSSSGTNIHLPASEMSNATGLTDTTAPSSNETKVSRTSGKKTRSPQATGSSILKAVVILLALHQNRDLQTSTPA